MRRLEKMNRERLWFGTNREIKVGLQGNEEKNIVTMSRERVKKEIQD